MTTSKPLMKVSVSSLAFAENGQVKGKQGACLRARQLRQAGVTTPNIPDSLQLIGDYWERQEEKRLQEFVDSTAGVSFTREKPVSKEIPELGLHLRGRVDFEVVIQGQQTFFIECKAVGSSNRRLSIIRKRSPDVMHIAQIIGYFLVTDVRMCVLKYAFVQLSSDSDELMIPACTEKAANRADFVVELVGHEILIDGKPFTYRLGDILQYLGLVSNLADLDAVADRPYVDPYNHFSGPCFQCPFSAACDDYDEQCLVAEPPPLSQFIEHGRKLASSLTQSTYSLWKPKRRSKA